MALQTTAIRIVLIEDDVTIREGYTYLINENPKYQVVNAYSNVESALKSIHQDDPHVILLDIELPGMNGTEGIPRLKAAVEDVYIIMLSVYENEQVVFDALSKGASGYLTKDASPQKIMNAIDEVLAGGGPMTINIARMVINSFKRSEQSPLTRRETEILEQIANGKTRGKIAEEMFIDLETVKSHLKNIYSKLDVHSRADAIKTARQNKYI